jgi:hypothetical protein
MRRKPIMMATAPVTSPVQAARPKLWKISAVVTPP